MGSKTFDGVWFISYSDDHDPPHVHGEYGQVTVVVDLLPNGKVRQSKRYDAITPKNGKRSHVRHILETASDNAEELTRVWEKMHGKTS